MGDYSGVGVGVGVGIGVVYVVVVAFSLWIGYLIMRTAVKNGILLAAAETARDLAIIDVQVDQDEVGLGSRSVPTAPAGWYPVDGGKRYWNGEQWTTADPRPN